jgi:hypothetical protein
MEPDHRLRTDARRPSRPLTITVSLLIAAAAVLLAATPADAGNYVVTQCSAANPSAGQATWERSSDHYESRSHCGTDDGLQAYHDAAESGLWHYGAWVWRAPAGTVFTSIQANASLTSQAGHRGQLAVTRPGGELVEFGTEHEDFRVHSIAGEFTQFHSWLRCVAPGAGRPCGRAGSDAGHAYVRGVFLRIEDRATPTLRLTGGSLLDDLVVRGVRELAFDAADTGSGIRTVFVEGNGALLATDTRNCALAGDYATALRPCPAATTESAGVATAHPAFATGPNTVTACAEDLALDGAPNRACERRSIWVDNACPGSAVGGADRLTAGWAEGAARAVVHSDEPGIVRGQLTGPAGPIAGATICVLARTLIAGYPIVVAAVGTSGADGRYAIELPPGPGREVFVHHAYGDRVIARHGLSLRSIARPTLTVSPGRARPRDRLRFSGALPGPACLDRVVKVQARIGRRRWQVFRTDRADRACGFEARYKLRATRAAERYRFRALVPQQAGYPFERGYSRTTKVTVQGRG